jgi:hypothetical protein
MQRDRKTQLEGRHYEQQCEELLALGKTMGQPRQKTQELVA